MLDGTHTAPGLWEMVHDCLCVLEDFEGGDVGVFEAFVGGVVDIVVVLVECGS